MKNFTCFDLRPNNGRKSFNRKATVVLVNGNAYLMSYHTPVAAIDSNGVFYRLWGGYSRTTLAHVNAFAALYGVPGVDKARWESLMVWDLVLDLDILGYGK